jgi:hypothetical protein
VNENAAKGSDSGSPRGVDNLGQRIFTHRRNGGTMKPKKKVFTNVLWVKMGYSVLNFCVIFIFKIFFFPLNQIKRNKNINVVCQFEDGR